MKKLECMANENNRKKPNDLDLCYVPSCNDFAEPITDAHKLHHISSTSCPCLKEVDLKLCSLKSKAHCGFL